jgi:hypothetical protein
MKYKEQQWALKWLLIETQLYERFKEKYGQDEK